jgi:hypothetical protein
LKSDIKTSIFAFFTAIYNAKAMPKPLNGEKTAKNAPKRLKKRKMSHFSAAIFQNKTHWRLIPH